MLRAFCLSSLICGLAPALDSVQDTCVPLLLRPGLPTEALSLRLFSDHSAAAPFEQAAFRDDDYSQTDFGLLAVASLLRREDWQLRGYAGARQRELSGDISFASGLVLPERIEQLAIGLSGKRQFGRSGALAWRLGLNSTSDRPFASRAETGLEAEILYMGYRHNRDAWLTGLIWTSFSEYPFPALGYFWHVNDSLTLNIGLPLFGLRWTPAERWTINAHAAPIIDDAALNIRRGFGEKTAQGHPYECGLTLYRDSWSARPTERRDDDDQLQFREWRAGLIGTWRFGPRGSLDLESGRAFHRLLREEEQAAPFEDSDYRSDRPVDDCWYLRASLALRF